MRTSRFGSLAVMAAASAMLIAGMAAPEPERRVYRKLPRGHALASDMSRKQSRAANRTKKQHLLKGVRP